MSPAAAASPASGPRIALPVALPFAIEGYPQDIAFDYLCRLNENAGMFGHFPLGFDLHWHGGLHIPAEEGTLVHNVFPGRIVAARLDRATDDAARPSHGFVIVRHEVELRSSGMKPRVFHSLHMHLHEEAVDDTCVPWLRRVCGQELSLCTRHRPNANANHRLLLWNNEVHAGTDRPMALGAPEGIARRMNGLREFVTAEFECTQVWHDERDNTFARLEHEGHTRWACVRSGATRYTDCPGLGAAGTGYSAHLKDLMNGGCVGFHNADEDLKRRLTLAVGEPVGRAGILPAPGPTVLGEHFEIFSGADLVSDDRVGSLAELPRKKAGVSAVFLTLTHATGSYANGDNAPLERADSYDASRNPPTGGPLNVHALHQSANASFALVDVGAERRWARYAWADEQGTVHRDGSLSLDGAVRWVLVDDAARTAIVHDAAAARAVAGCLTNADPDMEIHEGILKRPDLAAFYSTNENAPCLRYLYLHGISEWSTDPARALDTRRMAFVTAERRHEIAANWERFALWRNLPRDLLETDGFASRTQGDRVWQYRYHPIMFLKWLSERTGVACVSPPANWPQPSAERSAF